MPSRSKQGHLLDTFQISKSISQDRYLFRWSPLQAARDVQDGESVLPAVAVLQHFENYYFSVV